MTTRSRIIALLVLPAIAACVQSEGVTAVDEVEEAGYIDVLFIGNSYVYWGDLPELVAAISSQMGESERVRAGSVAFANVNLDDHWAAGDALDAIRRRKWEYVVLQQGPSSVEVNRQQLIRSARQFATPIVAAGGRPALFGAWPQEDRYVDFPRAIESYRLAAAAVDGLFLPISMAWYQILTERPDLPLYADGLHPNAAGNYLAAAVIYGAIYRKSVARLPDTIGDRFSVPAAAGAALREAADSALSRSGLLPARP